MASNKTNLTSKNVKNPLFSTGIANFPAEEFTQGVLLVPPPKESEQLLRKGLGGEIDTFLGQDVTDLFPCPLPSSENLKSDQAPTLLPPPPPILASNFRSVPARLPVVRPVEPIQPIADFQTDSEPDFKQILLDDSIPLYNPSAVLKSHRESGQELNRVAPNFDGGVPLFDPSYIGSVLPPHATKRPLPVRPDNVIGPTPAVLDPAYSSLSKHISTCSPSLVTDSGPPVSNTLFNTNTTESRKSSSSSSVHELNTFNLQDQRASASLTSSVSSPSLHSLPQKSSGLLFQAYPSESVLSLCPPAVGINQIPSNTGYKDHNSTVLPSAPFYPVSHFNQGSPYTSNQGPSAALLEPVGSSIPSVSGLPASSPLSPPSNPPINNFYNPNSSNGIQNLYNQQPTLSEVNALPLESTPVSNDLKSNETNSALTFPSSISDYSIPSFLNPLNLFKRGTSPSSKTEPRDDPLPPNPHNGQQQINTQSTGSENLNSNVSSEVVAPPFLPKSPESPSSKPTPLPPPPLSGFQVSSTPLTALPKIHHTLANSNPYSIHSQKKITAPAFKPEHYFTPIPVSELPQIDNNSQGPSQILQPSSDLLSQQPSNSIPESIVNNSSIDLYSADQQSLNQVIEVTSHLPTNILPPGPFVNPISSSSTLSNSALSNFIPADVPTFSTNTDYAAPPLLSNDSFEPIKSSVSSASLGNSSPFSETKTFTHPPSSQPFGFSPLNLPPQQGLNQAQASFSSPPTESSLGPPTSIQRTNYRLGSLKRPVYAHVPDLGITSTSRPVVMTDNQNSVNNVNQGLYQPLQSSNAPFDQIQQSQVFPVHQATAVEFHSSSTEDHRTALCEPIPSEQLSSLPPNVPFETLTNPVSHSGNDYFSGSAPSTDTISGEAAVFNEGPSSSSFFSTHTLPPSLSDFQNNLDLQKSAISSVPFQDLSQSVVNPMQSSHIDEVVQPPFNQIEVTSTANMMTPSPVVEIQYNQEAPLDFSSDKMPLPPLSNMIPSNFSPSSYPSVPLAAQSTMPMESSGNEQHSIPSSKSPIPSQSSNRKDGGSSSPFLTAHASSQQPYTAMAVSQTYRPVYHHWFYRRGDDKKNQWNPFSMADSLNLEQQFTSDAKSEGSRVVATDGGRYDVNVETRKRIAVYWHEKEGDVRRCSWFVKGPVDSKYQPYDENIATLLEEEYKNACTRNEWNRRVELADGEVIIIHSPNAIAHHMRSSSPDPWGNSPPVTEKHRVVKRGLDEFDIPEGEPTQVDHLLLLVHGIGKVCDLRFRSLVEVVDDFRNISVSLVGSHFKSAVERGKVGRVEVLPVEWHRALHTETIDQRLNNITLPSIPKARHFTNETLLDILFYTSPVFCEKIVEAVGAELNRVYSLYLKRNPGFKGGVSLGGHSLGSLILFDTLCHQKPPHPMLSSRPSVSFDEGDEDVTSLGCLKTRARLSRRMSYLTIGNSGAGQPYIAYPQLNFQPRSFFALGSPIGMFVTVRGVESLGEEFKFPTCPSFFNIFHPNDPVAYRMEGLINPDMAHHPAVLIPHHKGRKRMHLELKETMAHLTAAVKQKLLDSVKNTWNTVSSFTRFKLDTSVLENQVDKVLEDEILCKDRSDDSSSVSDSVETENAELKVGLLNGGRRIDYVLQEAPLETFNQYISAVRSHLVYWESEDTMLLILKEIYSTKGITADCQVPQPILPFDLTPEANADPGAAYSHYTVSPSPAPSRQHTIVEEPL